MYQLAQVKPVVKGCCSVLANDISSSGASPLTCHLNDMSNGKNFFFKVKFKNERNSGIVKAVNAIETSIYIYTFAFQRRGIPSCLNSKIEVLPQKFAAIKN